MEVLHKWVKAFYCSSSRARDRWNFYLPPRRRTRAHTLFQLCGWGCVCEEESFVHWSVMECHMVRFLTAGCSSVVLYSFVFVFSLLPTSTHRLVYHHHIWFRGAFLTHPISPRTHTHTYNKVRCFMRHMLLDTFLGLGCLPGGVWTRKATVEDDWIFGQFILLF